MQVPVPSNATCNSNRTCVFELVEDAFFNLEDSVITRARHTFVTTQADLLQVIFQFALFNPTHQKALMTLDRSQGCSCQMAERCLLQRCEAWLDRAFIQLRSYVSPSVLRSTY